MFYARFCSLFAGILQIVMKDLLNVHCCMYTTLHLSIVLNRKEISHNIHIKMREGWGGWGRGGFDIHNNTVGLRFFQGAYNIDNSHFDVGAAQNLVYMCRLCNYI